MAGVARRAHDQQQRRACRHALRGESAPLTATIGIRATLAFYVPPIIRPARAQAQHALMSLVTRVRPAAQPRERRLTLPLSWLIAEPELPALADIIGARRVRTAVMISSGSIPCR